MTMKCFTPRNFIIQLFEYITICTPDFTSSVRPKALTHMFCEKELLQVLYFLKIPFTSQYFFTEYV